jgi:hypothetical protein
MSREWLDEAEASIDVIKFPTKMRHTRCEFMEISMMLSMNLA